jgi:hypothetical protein
MFTLERVKAIYKAQLKLLKIHQYRDRFEISFI